MAETVYSATQTFDSLRGSRCVTVDAGSGDVTIQARHGDGNWITAETYDADTVQIMDFGNGRPWRFVVTGTATFAID